MIGVDAGSHPAVKTRPRPIARTLHQTVLYRIVMYVIEMPLEIFDGFQRLFPELRLPHTASVTNDGAEDWAGGNVG